MKPAKDLLRTRNEIGRAAGGVRSRFRAAFLAIVGAGILAPAAAAQTPFTITMEMDMGGTVLSARATMPDPLAAAGKILECGDAAESCMRDVVDAATPVLEASTSPPDRSASEQPEPSASPQPEPSASPKPEPSASPPPQSGGRPPEPAKDSGKRKQGSVEASKKSTGAPRTANGVSPTPEGTTLASRPEPAEGTSSPLTQERASPPPRPTPPEARLRGPDPVGLPPALAPGGDWNALFVILLLAAGSLALVLFLLASAPRHSLARVSYQLAERRYSLSLVGVVMFVGLAFGYLVAILLG
jgi:hypothetical protein